MVIRGLCENTDPRKIAKKLKKIKIEVEAFQMKSKRIKAPLPLNLIKMQNLAIYKVRKLFELDVHIELKKKSRNLGQ